MVDKPIAVTKFEFLLCVAFVKDNAYGLSRNSMDQDNIHCLYLLTDRWNLTNIPIPHLVSSLLTTDIYRTLFEDLSSCYLERFDCPSHGFFMGW